MSFFPSSKHHGVKSCPTCYARPSYRLRLIRVTSFIAISFIVLHNQLVWHGGEIFQISQPNITMTAVVPDENHTSMECHTLNELAHQMAEYSSPPNSTSYLKNKRLLAEANKYFIESPFFIFTSTTLNLHRAMTSYGLKRIRTESRTIDSDDPANQDVILFYWSGHLRAKQDMCRGSKCHEMHRIILQTEQMNRRMAPFKNCHLSPKCVIWEFSDFNLRPLSRE